MNRSATSTATCVGSPCQPPRFRRIAPHAANPSATSATVTTITRARIGLSSNATAPSSAPLSSTTAAVTVSTGIASSQAAVISALRATRARRSPSRRGRSASSPVVEIWSIRP